MVILVDAVSLLALSCGLLIYGLRLKYKLTQNGSALMQDEADVKRKVALLRRINSVLVVCCLCYGCRGFLLLVLLVDLVQNGVTVGGFIGAMPFVVWFVLTSWIPTVGPVSEFLHHTIK
jgi:hypothetical protein